MKQDPPARTKQSESSSTTRREFLARTAACAAALAGTRAGAQGAKKPNLLVLITDDQRWDLAGFMGHPIVQTPHLDRLAAQGVVFTNHCVTTPICCASRASMLTGLHSTSHRTEAFDRELPADLAAFCYPRMLREAGYLTGYVGKWGLGGPPPADQFDMYLGFGGQGKFFPHGEPGIHLETVLANQAIEVIENASREKPLCLTVAFKAPHVEDEDPRQYLYDPAFESLYQDVTIPPPALGTDADFAKLPAFIRESEGRVRWGRRFATPEMYQRSVKGYYRLVTGMDAAVGRIVESLERSGLADNTVIVFTSDNGIFNGERGLAGKWLLYEESIRVPFFIYDPRQPAEARGKRVDAMTLNIDLAPTLAEYANALPPVEMQGMSVRPLLRNPKASWRSEAYFEHHFTAPSAVIPRTEGVRTADWKYIRYLDAPPEHAEEIYDLKADPGEAVNLAADPAHAERLAALRGRWQVWTDALAAWRPGAGKPWADPA